MRKLFGTDGIRGVANVHPMTTEIAMQVGRGIAFLLKNNKYGHRIVIGKDTRLSGYMIENALAAGICSMGVDVLLVGPLPTPGIAFITTSMRADAGVVISASHNPFQDNGIKIFSRDGFKLPDQQEKLIEDLIFSQQLEVLRPVADEIGKAQRIDDARGRYIVFLKNTFPKQFTLEGFHIVLDCANGATYGVAPHVFEELGAKVTALGVSPNGKNINDECGALCPRLMANKVRELGADIGIALDGDGDRLIVADEKGAIVDGDHLMTICAADLMTRRKLKKKTLVATVMSNIGLSIALKEMGIRHIISQVGDRYVLEQMMTNGSVLGGEDSGHMIFLAHHTTGDGILTALKLIEAMLFESKTLSVLGDRMKVFPQALINVPVKEKADIESIPEILNAIRSAEADLGEKGRVLVRYSGTQPLCRVMVEGPANQETRAHCERIAATVQKMLGTPESIRSDSPKSSRASGTG